MRRPRVIIGAGHGGENTGIVCGDFVEKHVNLKLALELGLSLHDVPVDFELERYDDVVMSLAERGRLAREWGADFVIPIHGNGHPTSTSARRAEGYFWPGSRVGRIAAHAFVMALPRALGPGRIIEAINDPSTPEDDWIESPRAVLGAYDAPAMLAECGYATNKRDREYLLTDLGRSAIVCSLRASIVAAAQAILEIKP